jgi:signal transduction histidine kinase/CheY-like chemotaxis protein
MFAFISSDFKEGEIEKQQFVPAISEVNELNKHFSLLKINLKKTIKHLEDSFSEAKTALDYKSSFLANMSHEIRTPLNGVIGMIRILKETPLTVMQADHLQTANYSANHLLDLVNGILDYSKMEAGKMELEEIPFNLLDNLQKTMKMFEYKLLEKGLKMKLNFQFSTENMVIGDPTRLQQIIINLLNNAIKFTNEGTVTLSVTQLVKYDKYQRLRFSVQDTGIGISKEKIEKLFEAFKQADSSINRNFGGTGLGLTISKQLVNLMSAELMVTSKVDVGSDFYFELDLNVGDKIERDMLNPKNAGQGVDMYKSLKVLVAEDNLTNQKVINYMLTNAGVSIDFANNGLEACQLYENNNYDIILMDLRMPVMDGLQATKVIVQTKKYKIYNTPIVAVTANAFPEDRKGATDAGMTGFLSKPINPDELKEMLSSCREALKVEEDDLVFS